MKKKPTNATLEVRGTEIRVVRHQDEDYISLTDIAKSKNADHPDDLIRNWLRNRNTLELLGIWEQLHNPGFNPVEFDGVKKQAGLNSFTLTPKQWIEKTAATGIVSKAGRYGGTYAHIDVAFEFASWVSVEFKLYLIKEFQRLKEDENRRLSLAWNLNRTLAKINYRIHTDAIQTHLIPAKITPKQAAYTYASEADLLNVALFSQTVRQWFADHDLIESVLYLPENLFYNTTAPGIVLFLNRDKPKTRQGKVFLVNASQVFEKGDPENFITDAGIQRFVAIASRKMPGHFSS